MKKTTLSLVRGAMIAAMYVTLTLVFQPISFGAVQFRIAEALTLLPVLSAEAVPGLFVGCIIANLLGGGVWYDIVLGSIATLLAALCTRAFRKTPAIAAVFPALFNGIIIGPVVYFAYVHAPGEPVSIGTLLFTVLTVTLGEVVVCYVLGLPLCYALKSADAKLQKGKEKDS